ncbi:MAG: hypothetical protein ABIP51_14780 [Bacteroidia bacterium]
MLSFVKNNVFCILIISVLSACDQKKEGIEKSEAFKDSSIVSSAKSFTILLSGLIPPPMYSNAQDIVAKKYNINFIYAGGCIIDERLGDSISKFNEQTFASLKKRFNKDVSSEIFSQLDSETAFLTALDIIIRKNTDLKKTYPLADELIYYSKKDKNYTAHILVTEPDYKVLNFKLKLVATVDSLSKSISNIIAKDSIIKQFSDLQL